MKRYSEYKDSGVKWIGEIPGHWKIVRLKFVTENLDYLREPISAELRERKNPQYDYYGASGIIDKIDHYNVDDKVLLIGEDGANLLMRNLPLVYRAEGKFWVNNHAHILKTRLNDYSFFAHLLESQDYTLFVTGTAQPKLSQFNLGNVPLPISPINEQKIMGKYLDSKVAKIDEYISIAEKKIAALEELKQTIIAEAVTRGIHKDVPMKDSGVKWIGMIPEHWKVMRLKKVAKIYSGNGFKISLQGCSEGDYPFYKAGELNKSGIYINKSANYVSNRIVKEENLTTIPSHSILFPKIGEAMKKNGRKINQSSCCIDNNCGALSILCHKEMNNVFFYYITKCIDMAYYDNGGTIPCLNTQKLLSEFVAIPYLEEQQEIVTYLDSKVANINQLCQAERSQIEKLKEYKQRLISDVVTGKVKVTND